MTMSYRNTLAVAVLSVIAGAGAGGQAQAGPASVFTDHTAFISASSHLTTLDFGPLVTNGSYEQGFPSGFTLQGNTFSGYSGYLYVRPAGMLLSDASVYGWLGTYIAVNLASGIYDVGTNLTGFYGGVGTLTLDYTLADGTSSSFALPTTGSSQFLGLVSTVPIISIAYWDSNDFPILDQFQVGTPEPSTLGIASLAILTGLGFVQLRRARAA
jgi:hypothetical protein